MIQRQYGWIRELEDENIINETGTDPSEMILAMASTDDPPTYDIHAEPWADLFWQGSQGACQGHALAHMAQIVFAQNTGNRRHFSRAQCYYESQRHDGIRGDRGSTLTGGMKVATEDGIVLEDDWKYPSRYNNARPSNYNELPRVKFKHSKRMKDADEIWSFLLAGGVVQTGLTWNGSCERDYADSYSFNGAGGHSTILYGFESGSDDKWCIHHNSWKNWGIDRSGRSCWSKNFIAGVCKERWSVFIGYTVGEMEADGEIY